MVHDLRCASKKHAVLLQEGAGGVIEVKCNSARCGASRDTVVLHRFDTGTGQLTGTQRFKNP